MNNFTTSIRLPIEYKEKLDKAMREQERPMVWIIRKALDQYLADDEKKVRIESTPKSMIPYQKIVELYHEVLPELPKIKELTAKRRSQIAARWQEQLPDLDTWKRFFMYIRKSDWLMGKVDPSPGRKRFTANLEWITNQTNYANIVERKYHDK